MYTASRIVPDMQALENKVSTAYLLHTNVFNGNVTFKMSKTRINLPHPYLGSPFSFYTPSLDSAAQKHRISLSSPSMLLLMLSSLPGGDHLPPQWLQDTCITPLQEAHQSLPQRCHLYPFLPPFLSQGSPMPVTVPYAHALRFSNYFLQEAESSLKFRKQIEAFTHDLFQLPQKINRNKH